MILIFIAKCFFSRTSRHSTSRHSESVGRNQPERISRGIYCYSIRTHQTVSFLSARVSSTVYHPLVAAPMIDWEEVARESEIYREGWKKTQQASWTEVLSLHSSPYVTYPMVTTVFRLSFFLATVTHYSIPKTGKVFFFKFYCHYRSLVYCRKVSLLLKTLARPSTPLLMEKRFFIAYLFAVVGSYSSQKTKDGILEFPYDSSS